MNPLVTLCVPTYNRAGFLRESLAAIRGQTHEPLEILIADNASTDETQRICETAADEDARIRYIRHPQNIGLYPNHNFCIDHARGEYLCFFHDDDWYGPGLVARYAEFLQAHPDAGLVCADWDLMDDDGRVFAKRRSKAPLVQSGAAYTERTIRSGRSSLNCPGVCIRRRALGDIRFDEKGPIGFGDFVVWFQVGEQWSIGHLAQALWRYRIHRGSLSRRTILGMAGDYEKAVGAYLESRQARRPSERPLIVRWKRLMQRYIFWSLVYEVCRHLRNTPAAGDKTLFDAIGYRLTDAELSQARQLLDRHRSSSLEHLVLHMIEKLIDRRWTGPLSWASRRISISWARAVLRLR